MRLSKLSSQEMIVEDFEKASKQILSQTALIKELSEKVVKLEIRLDFIETDMKETEENIEEIHSFEMKIHVFSVIYNQAFAKIFKILGIFLKVVTSKN